MLRWILNAATLFWVMLLGLALMTLITSGHPLSASLYLVAIPAAMVIMTIVIKRIAEDPRLAPGAIAGGSITAGLAVMMLMGILGAGV
ncbi:MAG: hypothetical protein EON59_05065 [Alphaproteobacteria bacterium]|nr:MAG: hypothetical protein EON59_05065 [Alphaproteobacteria bacterium]